MSTRATRLGVERLEEDSLSVRPAYKLTDVEVIPIDWSDTTLGGLLASDGGSIKTGPFGTLLKASEYSAEGVPIISVGEVGFGILDVREDTPKAPPEVVKRLPEYVLRCGDIVFGRKGAVDRSGLVSPQQDGWFLGSDGIRLRLPPSVDPGFVSYQLQREPVQKWLQANATGTTMASLNQDVLKRVQVIVAPLFEQQSIAEALSDVDGLIGALEKLIAKKRAIKQAAMQELLTGKTRLPGFSGKWHALALREGVALTSGQHVLAQYCNTMGEGVPYLTGPADFPDGQIILTKYTTKPGTLCEPGHILVTVKGSGAGTLVVADANYCISRQLMAIRVHAWDSQFIFYSLLQNATKLQAASTSLIPGLSRADILGQDLPLPVDRKEQKAIATVLSDKDAEIEALEHRRDKTRQIKQGMMQQLLTGRIRLIEPQTLVARPEAATGKAKSRNRAFNDAVVISVLAKHFGSKEYPLGRMRYQKLSYLLHRHAEGQVEGYLKKAAGPYNPNTRYGGSEKIALENGYIREHQSGEYHGFVAADNIAEAEAYFDKRYGSQCAGWLEQFRRKRNDDLELLATVDMAAEELRAAGKSVDVAGVKEILRGSADWKPKLDRPVFSDAKIAKAIETCRKLFQ